MTNPALATAHVAQCLNVRLVTAKERADTITRARPRHAIQKKTCTNASCFVFRRMPRGGDVRGGGRDKKPGRSEAPRSVGGEEQGDKDSQRGKNKNKKEKKVLRSLCVPFQVKISIARD